MIIKESGFHLYCTFECHFKPNKKKRELGDPVVYGWSKYQFLLFSEQTVVQYGASETNHSPNLALK